MNNLKKIRKDKKITQKELAELADISLRTVQKYELGELNLEKAQVCIILKICKALSCTVEDLINI